MTPISNYYLPGLEVYSDRADWQNRNPGKTLAPFSTVRKPKYWRDTTIKPGARKLVYTVLGLKDDGQPALGTDGKPYLDLIILDAVEAAALNLPSGAGAATEAESLPAVPIPLGPLPDGAELVWVFPAGVLVRTKDEQLSAVVDFTKRDQLLLEGIAGALGVTVA